VVTMTVEWPSGLEQLFGNLTANHCLTLVEGQTPTSVFQPPFSGTASRTLTLQPNPSTDSVTVVWEQQEPEILLLQIIDLQGRIVLTQKINGISGQNEWVWNGRDGQGTKVPSGNYMVALQGNNWQAVEQLMRLK